MGLKIRRKDTAPKEENRVFSPTPSTRVFFLTPGDFLTRHPPIRKPLPEGKLWGRNTPSTYKQPPPHPPIRVYEEVVKEMLHQRAQLHG